MGPHINSLPPGKIFMFFCCLLIFFKINFFEKFFQNYHLSVKQIGSDQAQRFVGPDLGPNCLQMTLGDKELRVI